MKRRQFVISAAATVPIAGCVGNVEDVAGSFESTPEPITEEEIEDDGNGALITTEEISIEPVRNDRLNPSDGANADMNAIEIAVHEWVNGARREFGLGLLTYSDSHSETAQAHSRSMAHNDYFSHEGPQGQEFRPTGCNPWGENLYRYKGPNDGPEAIGRAAVRSWLNSDRHRENMLRKEFTGHGVGAGNEGDNWVYVTSTLCG